jgi:hypothetical protein
MKKIFLYLIFVCILLILMINVNAEWVVQDSGITLTSSQNLVYLMGNAIKIIGGNATGLNLTKHSSDTATICGLFIHQTTITALSTENFVGDTCTITYDLVNNTEYNIATWKGGNTYTEYYEATALLPMNLSHILWEGYVIGNGGGATTWAVEDTGYIASIYKLEINVEGKETPVNETETNTTTNTTITQTQALITIGEGLNLIGVNIYIMVLVLLLIIFLYLGFKVNFVLWCVSGAMFWCIGLIDFNTIDDSLSEYAIWKLIFYIAIGIIFCFAGVMLEIMKGDKQKPKTMYETFY